MGVVVISMYENMKTLLYAVLLVFNNYANNN